MDHMFLFASGVVIGVLVAAPIGPVNLICIRRTLAYGKLNGFMSGLGAALGDGVFAAIIAFGLTAITQLIAGFSCTLQLAGGLLLLGFGVHTFRAEPVAVTTPNVEGVASGRRNVIGAMLSTFALTITNPATLLGFAALFTGLGTLGQAGVGVVSYGSATVLVVAVMVGSAGWWLALTAITGLFHRQLGPKAMKRINQGSGLLIGAFGIFVLGHMIFECVPRWTN